MNGSAAETRPRSGVHRIKHCALWTACWWTEPLWASEMEQIQVRIQQAVFFIVLPRIHRATHSTCQLPCVMLAE